MNRNSSLALLVALPLATGLVGATQLSNRGEAMVDAMIGALDAMGLVEKGKKFRAPQDGGGPAETLAGSGLQMPGSSSFGSWGNPMSPMSPARRNPRSNTPTGRRSSSPTACRTRYLWRVAERTARKASLPRRSTKSWRIGCAPLLRTGGSGCESNTPAPGLPPHTGFEDRGRHRTTTTPIYSI